MLALLHPAPAMLRQLAVLLAALLAPAVLGKGRRSDPRYPGVDWQLTHDKLLDYCLSCVKGSGLDAVEAVEYALEKAFAPTARPWDPQKGSILAFLGSYANTKIAHMRKSRHHKRVQRGKQLEGVADTHGAQDADPVTSLRDDGDEHNALRIFTTLKERLEGYALPLFLIAIYEEGGHETPEESTHRALAKGHSEAELTAARQKIHREVVKLMGEEALEDAYGNRPGAR